MRRILLRVEARAQLGHVSTASKRHMLTECDLIMRYRPVEAVEKFDYTVDGTDIHDSRRDDDAEYQHLHMAVQGLRLLVLTFEVDLMERPILRATPGVLDHQEAEEGHGSYTTDIGSGLRRRWRVQQGLTNLNE